MLELLQYVLSSYWTFFGTIILCWTCVLPPLAVAIEIAGRLRPVRSCEVAHGSGEPRQLAGGDRK